VRGIGAQRVGSGGEDHALPVCAQRCGKRLETAEVGELQHVVTVDAEHLVNEAVRIVHWLAVHTKDGDVSTSLPGIAIGGGSSLRCCCCLYVVSIGTT
jgi:hypothetical protein